MDKLERDLLAKVAAVPCGEKLPLSRIARDLDCSTSVAISAVAALVMSRALDPITVRPPVAHAKPVASGLASVAELLAECEAFMKRTGMVQSTLGKRAAGSYSFVSNLRNGKQGPRPATIARVRQFMADFEGRPPVLAAAPSTVRGKAAPMPGAVEEVGPAVARGEPAAPRARVTGQQLSDEILAFVAGGSGITMAEFAELMGRTVAGVANIAKANYPKPETIARVRSIIAGDRGKFVAAHKAPTNEHSQSIERVAQRRVQTDAAAARRLPGETLADAVKREAEEAGARRANARESKGVRTLETTRERFARLAREVEAEEQEAGALEREALRERELDELVSPSSVLRRAQRDWPAQCERVKAIAAELGVGLGEAWRRVIAAGVDCMVEAEA